MAQMARVAGLALALPVLAAMVHETTHAYQFWQAGLAAEELCFLGYRQAGDDAHIGGWAIPSLAESGQLTALENRRIAYEAEAYLAEAIFVVAILFVALRNDREGLGKKGAQLLKK